MKSLPAARAERPLLYRGQCQARPDDRMLSPFCALANDATRGSRFSSRLAGSHLMMGDAILQIYPPEGDRCEPISSALRWPCGKARGSAEGSRRDFHWLL